MSYTPLPPRLQTSSCIHFQDFPVCDSPVPFKVRIVFSYCVGPKLRAAFAFPDVLCNLRGTGNVDTKSLHDQYGPVVRVAPNTLSFNTAQAWKGAMRRHNRPRNRLTFHGDIYGLRTDRTELAKDPGYYIKGPAIQILSMIMG
jgi:hypothetical protein